MRDFQEFVDFYKKLNPEKKYIPCDVRDWVFYQSMIRENIRKHEQQENDLLDKIFEYFKKTYSREQLLEAGFYGEDAKRDFLEKIDCRNHWGFSK
jgi:hypothetical protein